MVKKPEMTALQWIFKTGNNLIMTLLVPLEKPGGIFRFLFKVPILLDTIGLNALIPDWILLLTSKGRKTGRQIVTPVEYIYHSEDGSYWIMSGWRGNADWYKNIRDDNFVKIKVKGKQIQATARPLTEKEVLSYLQLILDINPGAIAIFSRWAGKNIDPTDMGLQQVCGDFPGYALITDQPPK
jgi:deazaflavin-dependent oxidoreductase (nitroreductase family)